MATDLPLRNAVLRAPGPRCPGASPRSRCTHLLACARRVGSFARSYAMSVHLRVCGCGACETVCVRQRGCSRGPYPARGVLAAQRACRLRIPAGGRAGTGDRHKVVKVVPQHLLAQLLAVALLELGVVCPHRISCRAAVESAGKLWAGGRAVGERGKGAREEGGMRGRC